MKVKVCPKCGKHNLESAWNCVDCGETLSVKTIMDTDSGQLLSVSPIAGHMTLSEISAYFEDDVAETLKTTVRIDEDILWGCNFAKLSKVPPYIFGYLIITSRQLVCVQFISDTKRDKASSGIQLLLDPLIFLIKELFSVYEDSSHPWAAVGLSNVPYPSQKLTPTEQSSRKVITNHLKNLNTIQLATSWCKEFPINSLAISFGKDNEFSVAFYSPHQAEKTHQVLVTQLDKSST